MKTKSNFFTCHIVANDDDTWKLEFDDRSEETRLRLECNAGTHRSSWSLP